MSQTENTVPKDSESFAEENSQAEKLIDTCDLAGAAKILVPVVEQDPKNWRAFNNMGIISWMQQAYQDAYTMFEKAVSLRPAYGDALINLFDAGLKLHRIDDALPYFETAVEEDPGLEEIKVICESIKEQGNEIYVSERALKIGAFNPLIEEAKALLDDGKFYEAMDKFLKVNDTEGPNAEAFCGLGVISYYHKRYEDAFSLFFESIKLNPMQTDTFLNLLDSAKASGKVELAKQIFDVYVKEMPTLSDIAEEFTNA